MRNKFPMVGGFESPLVMDSEPVTFESRSGRCPIPVHRASHQSSFKLNGTQSPFLLSGSIPSTVKNEVIKSSWVGTPRLAWALLSGKTTLKKRERVTQTLSLFSSIEEMGVGGFASVWFLPFLTVFLTQS